MLIGWTTTATLDDAERLAEGAVKMRLAACGQVDGPITSVYHWDGEVRKDQEFRVVFKFTAERAEALETWIEENHPYDTPQWIAVAAERISQNYLIWARKQTT